MENVRARRRSIVFQDEYADRRLLENLRVGIMIGGNFVFYPFNYVQTLMQLGYEPLPAYPSTSLMGRPYSALPNGFEYANYIRGSDGCRGLYRAVCPAMLSVIVGYVGSQGVASILRVKIPSIDNEDPTPDDQLYDEYALNLKRDLVLATSYMIISQPLHVIAVRRMAQYVGNEDLYNSMYGSIKEIFNTEGFLGFFDGVVPRTIGVLFSIILADSTMFLLSKYVLKGQISRESAAIVTRLMFDSIMYPFQVVATVMAVNATNLGVVAEKYSNWLECWKDLSEKNCLDRGGSFFWRSVN